MVLLPLIGVFAALIAVGAVIMSVVLVIVMVVFVTAGSSTFVAVMTGAVGSVTGVFAGLLPGKRLWARFTRSRAV